MTSPSPKLLRHRDVITALTRPQELWSPTCSRFVVQFSVTIVCLLCRQVKANLMLSTQSWPQEVTGDPVFPFVVALFSLLCFL